jgi:hypothetical protein
MKILITEEQLKRIKGEMEEALGVPEGILEAGEEIYDLILQELNEFNGSIDELNKDGFEIDKEFTVGGHTFNKIRVKFDIEEHPQAKNADMAGMSSENESELEDRLVFRSVRDPQEVIIGFKFFIEPGKEIDVIKNYLKRHRNEDIPSLSHEIKHAFRDVKQKTEPMHQRVGYGAIQQHKQLFGFITELNEFLYNSYFIHAVENVVRPTELAAEMRINNVSRKEFLKFFLNTEIIQRLKMIQNFSYENLKGELHSSENIKKIKKVLNTVGIDYRGKDDDGVIDEFLKMFLVSLTNRKNELMHTFLANNPIEQILGLRGVKDKFFRKYVAETTKYGYDYDAFFEDEEENFHRVATMMIKKLAKLYAMAKNSPE